MDDVKKTVHICDRCKKAECNHWIPLGVTVDRRTDGAGSMEDVWESVDLCQKCMGNVIENMVANMDHDAAKAWLKMARGA